MKKLLSALAVVCTMTLIPTLAHADTIYSLTLTPSFYGPVGGTGSLDVNLAPGGSNLNYSTLGPTDLIESLTFSLDSGAFDFSLAGAPSNYANATFNSAGALTSLAYDGNDGTLAITLDAGSLYYTFSDTSDGALDSSGIVTAGAGVTSSVTPEPSSLFLLGTGVLGLAVVIRRRTLA